MTMPTVPTVRIPIPDTDQVVELIVGTPVIIFDTRKGKQPVVPGIIHHVDPKGRAVIYMFVPSGNPIVKGMPHIYEKDAESKAVRYWTHDPHPR